MRHGFSIWLDLLRAAAALTVLFGHMAHLRFTHGELFFLRMWNVASDAIIVFFVLSGCVIAYALERDGSLGRFAFNRLTRLLSVILPAICLTIVLDRIGFGIAPAAYPTGFYNDASVGETLLRGLTFSQEWQGLTDRIRLGSNGPLWALSYEAAYYAMFAISVFLRGMLRFVLLALSAIMIGLPILLLMPAWLVGVYVWLRVTDPEIEPPNVVSALGLAIAGPALILWCKAVDLPHVLMLGTVWVMEPLDVSAILVYSEEVLWNTLLAILIGTHLIGIHALSPHIARMINTRTQASIRWLAGASFSIYVVHYPVLHLLDALIPGRAQAHNFTLFAVTMGVAMIFAHLFERPLPVYRRVLLRLFPRLRPADPQPQI